MRKSIHSPEYKRVMLKLVEMREAAGLSQRVLAKRLDREPSFVWRIENGERRLDMLEFHWVCQALGQDSAAAYRQLLKEFSREAPAAYPLPDPVRKVAEQR